MLKIRDTKVIRNKKTTAIDITHANQFGKNGSSNPPKNFGITANTNPDDTKQTATTGAGCAEQSLLHDFSTKSATKQQTTIPIINTINTIDLPSIKLFNFFISLFFEVNTIDWSFKIL